MTTTSPHGGRSDTTSHHHLNYFIAAMWLSIARATARPLRMVGVRQSGALSRVVFLSSTAKRQATATAKKPVAAKKAPAKKPAAKGRAVAAKKPAAKKPAAKKKAVAKKAAPKKKKKAVPKKKPVARRKKVLTPEQKKVLQVRELKRTALLTPGATREPTPRPAQAWKIFLSKDTQALKDATDQQAGLASWVRDMSTKFRALSPTELEVSFTPSPHPGLPTNPATGSEPRGSAQQATQ